MVMGTLLLFTIQILDTVLVQNSDQNSPSQVFKWFTHSYTGHLIAWVFRSFQFWGVKTFKWLLYFSSILSPVIEKFSPGVNFIKALMPALFYWQENANKIVLAFKKPLFGQQILSNMLPI